MEENTTPDIYHVVARVTYQGESLETECKFCVMALDFEEALKEARKYLRAFVHGTVTKVECLGDAKNTNESL